MAPTSSRTMETALSDRDRETLLGLAGGAIRHGLAARRTPEVDIAGLTPPLRGEGASFVTLKRGDALRGCVGSMVAVRPLAEDVVSNAFGAAFSDSRFPALRRGEYAGLTLGISVLGPLEPLPAHAADDVIESLRTGRDGLVLTNAADGRRALFLPQVWDLLPEPADFVAQLKDKAGFAEDEWPSSISAFRFATHSFAGPLAPRGVTQRF